MLLRLMTDQANKKADIIITVEDDCPVKDRVDVGDELISLE